MSQERLTRNMAKATMWSGFAEVGAKLVAPITNAVLARLLVPEAFGVVATLTLVVSFAEIFTDAGFQKYLVQHEFEDEDDLNLSTNVAFWTNLIFSLILWGGISLFAEPIAKAVGSPGCGKAVIVMSLQIPLLAFSSIQMARYRRDLNFKGLFFVRMITSAVPLVVTVPLAVIFRSYWALVVGTLCKDLLNALILTLRSNWKPQLRYRWKKLKTMLSFSIWTIVENCSVWLTNNIGTFIVAQVLTEHYLGLYKNAIVTVNGYMNIISATIMQVLFSGLSRCQNDDETFRQVYFKFQRMAALLVVPLGIGIFLFRDLAVSILLGSQWVEVGDFLGLWSLTSALAIIFCNMSSEAFRSKGKPWISVLSQALHLSALIPVLLITMDDGFGPLTMARSLVRFQAILVSLLLLHFTIKIRIWDVVKNVWPSVLSALIMAVVGYLLQPLLPSILWQFLVIMLCVVVYLLCMLLIPAGRKQLMEVPILSEFLRKLGRKRTNSKEN